MSNRPTEPAQPSRLRFTVTIRPGEAAGAADGEPADVLLVTAVRGVWPERSFRTAQHGPKGPEPIEAALLHDLGRHLLARAVDSGRLSEALTRVTVTALHELRRVDTS